jgi:hypothetical protein
MSELVGWIAAVAEERDPARGFAERKIAPEGDVRSLRGADRSAEWQQLPAHHFPATPIGDEGARQETALDRNPELWLYRGRTAALLRRYLRVSLETGRVPSILGREFFRAKVTSYTATTFEDRVIFVHDVEACLSRLAELDRRLIACVILQEHEQWDAARILNCGRATVQRRLYEVLDLLSEDFLRVGLLVALPSRRGSSQ